jgi:hypothetical protein
MTMLTNCSRDVHSRTLSSLTSYPRTMESEKPQKCNCEGCLAALRWGPGLCSCGDCAECWA